MGCIATWQVIYRLPLSRVFNTVPSHLRGTPVHALRHCQSSSPLHRTATRNQYQATSRPSAKPNLGDAAHGDILLLGTCGAQKHGLRSPFHSHQPLQPRVLDVNCVLRQRAAVTRCTHALSSQSSRWQLRIVAGSCIVTVTATTVTLTCNAELALLDVIV